MLAQEADVVVVGGGNAAYCAALAARELDASVVMLEAAPEMERGGNSRFTGGLVRFAYSGLDDLLKLVPDMSEHDQINSDFGTYTRDQFFDDIDRLTQDRADQDLIPILVDRSLDTMVWLQNLGVRFVPAYGHQAFKVDGKLKFWGGASIIINGGGQGLIEDLSKAAENHHIQIQYSSRVVSLVYDGNAVRGIVIRRQGEFSTIRAKSVVLASGGFESNTEWRTRYLGPGWDLVKVRGTRYNMGDGIRMALDIGAMPYGNWSGCHAVGWDRNAPEFGDLSVGDGFQKHSYPLGIIVNAHGKRFVDEGADFRNFTYAKYGAEILQQPGQFAWQIFDGKVLSMLRDEYRIREATRVRANTIDELAYKLDGVDPQSLLAEIETFNNAVRTDMPFRPDVKDGRCTEGITVPKSNWTNPLDTPPFEAYATTCGITFTFGGLRINTQAQVLDVEEQPITGLFAAGELVGGLFYFNYPGGTGLTSGAVFGKIAGNSAGARCSSSSMASIG